MLFCFSLADVPLNKRITHDHIVSKLTEKDYIVSSKHLKRHTKMFVKGIQGHNESFFPLCALLHMTLGNV